jgi:DNA-binding IscR family transcriptional regulator
MSNAQKVPPEMIEKVLGALETERLISRTADQPPGFVLAVPPEETTVAEVVGALRRHQDAGTRKVELSEMPVVETLLGTIDRGIEAALGDMTLKTLAQSAAEEPEST